MICPDYSEASKFADLWVSVKQGTDAALGMAMGHVILKEFHVDRQVDYFTDYAGRYTDMPMLVRLVRDEKGNLGPEGRIRAKDVVWHDEAPEGKLDLLVTLDFRMSTTAVYSDIVLPTATWYEKNDLNTSDMHPFIHPLSAAVDPIWESCSDRDIYKGLAHAPHHRRGQPYTVRRRSGGRSRFRRGPREGHAGDQAIARKPGALRRSRARTLSLTTQVREAAAQEGISPGAFLSRATRIFTNEASEDDWLSLMEAMGRADDPGLVCLRRMLAFAFCPRGAAHACSHAQA